MQFLKIDSPKVRGMISNPAFLSRMKQPVKMIFNQNIPFLIGHSRDAKKIYIDRDVKRFWKYKNKTIDIFKFLIMKDKSQKTLIDLFGLDYQNAHYVSVWAVVFPEVKKAGIEWEDYIKHISPQMKLPSDHNLKNIPGDLDLVPYGEDEGKILKKKLEKRGKSATNIRKGRLSQLQKNQTTTRL